MNPAAISVEPPVLAIVLALGAMFLAAWVLRGRAIPLAARLDSALPQTQCTQCGYDGCRPYAEAIAAGRAAINRCPPGGDRVIRKLAAITGQPLRALDTSCGPHKPRRVALVDESRCIGCTLCIQACPVDAIVGAAKVMHTVIAAHCTGCELCLPPCPVDCITLVRPAWGPADLLSGTRQAQADLARQRFERRLQRLARDRIAQTERLASGAVTSRHLATRLRAAPGSSPDSAAERKRAIVQAALARARSRLSARTANGE